MAPPLVVRILGDAKKFTQTMDGVESRIGSFAVKAGKVGLAGGAAFATASAGAATGLFKLGESFDEAFDTIRVGTGATGEAFGGLQDDFRGVLTSVPTDFGEAAGAVADLNTRLGLTGQPLQDLATDFIQLGKVTGSDTAGNVDRLTRVFGDWGVSVDQQSPTLDKLFRASQNSGIGIDELGTSLVQFGAPLRNLGFGLDESSALLSVFNKTGVNTEGVVAGLKIGVGTLAKAGEDVPTTFRRVVDEITELGPGTDATRKAIELFGQRAGPDLADAIAGGKFELDEMLAAIQGGSETIDAAEGDTRSFGEQWTLFKNNVLVKLEPLATRVFAKMGEIMETLLPKVDPFFARVGEVTDSVLPRFQAVWDGLVPVLQVQVPQAVGAVGTAVGLIAGIAEEVAARAQPFIRFLGFLIDHRDEVVGALTAFAVVQTAILIPSVIASTAAWIANAVAVVVATAPFIAAAVVIGGLGVLVVKLWKSNETFRKIVLKVKDVVWDIVRGALPAMVAVFDAAREAVKKVAGWLDTAWEAIKTGIGAVQDLIGWLGELNTKITGVGLEIVGFFTGIPGEILGAVQSWVDAGVALGGAVLDGIKAGLSAVSGFAGGVASAIWDAVKAGMNAQVIDPLNAAIPNSLGIGPFAIDLPDAPVPRLAMGGTVGGVVDVGERGRERVLLPAGSRVVPNHQLDPVGSIVVNVTSPSDPRRIAREVAWAIRTSGRA